MKSIYFATALFCCLIRMPQLHAQIFTAANFQVTDLNGNVHELYDYLDAGKSVVLEFFAPWCGPCIDIHESGILQEVYLERGPGTSAHDVMIISMETDISTDDYWTYGGIPDFTDVPYPVVDLQADDFDNMTAYQQWFQYWPVVLAICPDRTMRQIAVETKEQVLSELIVPRVYAGEDGKINCYFPTLQATVNDTDKPYIIFNWVRLLPNGSATAPPFPYNELQPVVTQAGTFVLAAQNIVNGCGSIDTVVVTGIDIDPPLLTTDNDTLLLNCLNDTIEIFTNGLFGAGIWQRSWSTADGQILEIVDTTAHHIVALGPGTYETTTFDSLNGCSSSLSIVVLDAPGIFFSHLYLTDPSPGQADGELELYVTGGTGILSYQWSNGDTGQLAVNLPMGAYSCTVSDENGCVEVFGPYMLGSTGTNERNHQYTVSVYPQPAADRVSFRLNGYAGNGTLELYDAKGRLVLTRTLDAGMAMVEVGDWPGGLYYFRIKNTELELASGKWIVW